MQPYVKPPDSLIFNVREAHRRIEKGHCREELHSRRRSRRATLLSAEEESLVGVARQEGLLSRRRCRRATLLSAEEESPVERVEVKQNDVKCSDLYLSLLDNAALREASGQGR